jgi:hypothetical protein
MSILSSLLGITKSQPAQVIPASITEPKIAEEIAPFLKDILGKGQALYKQRTEEGFVPFEGQTLADVTAQQQQAQEGIAGLVGTQAPAFEEARGLVRGIAERPTAEALEEYMSPYQQAVIDVEKRKAQEAFERDTLPKIRAAQIGAGAFGGTRGTMLEAQTLGEQAQLLADIQARGQQQAFQDARQAFAQQKAREAQAAEGLTGLATGQFGAQTRELGALEAVGREQQQRQQQLLDESYQRFLQERGFPEQQLGQYQALVAGTPISQGNVTYQQAKFQPSPLASALGTVSGALGTYEKARDVGLFSKGGGIKEGIASLPVVNRQFAGQTAMTQEEIDELDKDIEEASPNNNMSYNMQNFGAEGEFGGEAQGELIQSGLDDTIASQVPGDKPGPMSALENALQSIAAERKKISEEVIPAKLSSVESLEKFISAEDKKDAERIRKEKEQTQKGRKAQFFVDLAAGLFEGGGGGFGGDLARAGERVVKGQKEYENIISGLNKEERGLARQAIMNKFNTQMTKYQIMLEKGQLKRDQFNDIVAGMNAEASAILKTLSAVEATNKPAKDSIAIADDILNNFIAYGNADIARDTLKANKAFMRQQDIDRVLNAIGRDTQTPQDESKRFNTSIEEKKDRNIEVD